MSRLDSAIRRLEAQRTCLETAAAMIAEVPGPVLEFGLGNGRTFDHLRQILPDREIFEFDRQVAAHPDCIPDDDHMILGDFRDTVPQALERVGAPAAMIHFDIGSGDAAANAELASWMAGATKDLLATNGVALADQELIGSPWRTLALPDGVAPGRYFMYRA
ncbi:MAG: class I SAM-dependent methyltransferase [Pseudomonadota bacterium]